MSEEGYTGRDNLEVMLDARRYNAWLCSLITRRAAPGSRIVDFGAGAGTFARMVRDKGYEVICVEPDAVLKSQLRSQGFEVFSSVDELPANTYDLVYTLNVLEHIEDYQAALYALRRPLRRGGQLLVYVPTFQVLYSSMDRKVGHFRRYRRTPLARMVASAGFDVRESCYADAIGYAASLAYRLSGNNDGTLNPGAIRFYDTFVFPLSRLADLVLQKVIGKNALVVGVAR